MVLPANRIKMGSAATATCTSGRDYVGPDSFAWKVNDGSADSNVATCSIVVTAAVPVPEPRTTACVIENGSVDIPASYTGGGGYSPTIKHSDPAHPTGRFAG